ncbi:hypothetical protein HYS92_01360 [Candidatus Daviesbacteria bacterium]|nr:hypothetical protein [Candidatus Daviesbacteria bacterium]
MKKMQTRIQVILIVILAITALSLILSQSAAPDNPLLFSLKRVQEKIYLNFKSNPTDKLDYMSSLLDARLAEIAAILDHKSYDFLLPSSLRYSTTAGQITDLIIANNLKDKVAAVKTQFTNHKKILNDLYVAYPKNTQNLEYKYLEDDINYLNIYLDKLSEVK